MIPGLPWPSAASGEAGSNRPLHMTFTPAAFRFHPGKAIMRRKLGEKSE